MQRAAERRVWELGARAERGGDGVPVGAKPSGQEADENLEGRAERRRGEEDVVGVHGRRGRPVEHLAGAAEQTAAAVEEHEVRLERGVGEEPADERPRVEPGAGGECPRRGAAPEEGREVGGGGRKHLRWPGRRATSNGTAVARSQKDVKVGAREGPSLTGPLAWKPNTWLASG